MRFLILVLALSTALALPAAAHNGGDVTVGDGNGSSVTIHDNGCIEATSGPGTGNLGTSHVDRKKGPAAGPCRR